MIAFIITDFTRENYKNLASSLDPFFDVRFSPAIFVQPNEIFDSEVVDRESLLADLAREPELGEVGCAMAHRNIYMKMIAENLRYALILEDDAMVSDPRKLFERVQELEVFFGQGKPLIVNLIATAMHRNYFSEGSRIPKAWKPSASPGTTTAYLINSEAALIFHYFQNPVRYKADWPNPKRSVEIHLEMEPNVTPDGSIPSLIDTEKRRVQIPFRRKISVWTGVWYLVNRRNFQSPRTYWNQVLGLRFFWHLYAFLARVAPPKALPPK